MRPINNLIFIVSALTALTFSSVTTAQTAVFINEIHYDNASSDTGEMVEIAGPAGTDLSGWNLVLYNGNGGGVYATLALSGSLPDEGAEFGAASFAKAGIQNGSPDGLALQDGGGSIVQFLSYEGSITATSGPALGLTSTDIGVSEPSNTPIGESLQLVGTGFTYEDFTWQSPALSSFGLLNSGQIFDDDDGGNPPTPPVNTDARINEIHYDNAGSDTGEAIEILGSAGTTLEGWSLVLYNGNGGGVYNTQSLSGVLPACTETQGVLHFEISGIQNGSPDGIALVDPTGVAVEFLSYEGSFTAASGPAAGMTSVDIGVSETSSTPIGSSLQLSTAGAGWQPPATSNFGVCSVPPPELACTDPATLIHEIQGAGASSPLAGSTVTVDAVVVGEFSGLGGYYLQEEDAEVDADPSTSEGIFVFSPDSSVLIGDRVRVRGEVDEFFGLTEITNVDAFKVCGTGLSATPATLILPLASTADLEAMEGMSVLMQQPLAIAEYFNYDRFGEMVLALPMPGDDRPLQPTSLVAPGLDANALQAQNDLRRITLDDGLTSQGPSVLRHPNGQPFSLTNGFRGGDLVTDVAGVIHYSFGIYRVQPTAPASHIPLNTRPDFPDDVGGTLRVASFNVLNYFTTLDQGGAKCGPSNLGCRGADNAEEFTRQRDKILAALSSMDADILGLVELENNVSDATADLTTGLSAATGDSYAFIDTGFIGTDAIKVGLIYRSDRVAPSGSHAVLDTSVDPRFLDDKNRPVLAQTFTELASGARLTVAINHLKSKGSNCNALGDPDTGDGQANCNLTRTAAAMAEVDWLAVDPTASGDPDVIILGDLNAYAMEDPVRAIEAGADDVPGNSDDYVNLIADEQGRSAYSYAFNGQFGYLDHALASSSLLPQVTGVTEWHINADEPDVLDYDTSFKPPEQDVLYEPNAFRSSDHDPVIVGLALSASGNDILAYFDAGIAAGTIAGVDRGKSSKSKDAENKAAKVRRTLDRATQDELNGDQTSACKNFGKAEDYLGDWKVDGSGKTAVANMVANYLEANCPG